MFHSWGGDGGSRTSWLQRQPAIVSLTLRALASSRMWERPSTPTPSAHASMSASGVRRHDFESFFLTHEPAISGFLWRMTGDEQAASDLSQETFLRAWSQFDRIRAYDKPSAWLFRVATNLALRHIQRRAAPVGGATQFDDTQEPGASDPAMRFAERDLVRETLLELPPKSRALLILREVYGLSGQEVCETLKMSSEAVKVGLWRARQRFREAYLRKEGAI